MRRRVFVTGANGAVGRAVLSRALDLHGTEVELVAAVRSERAAAQLSSLPLEEGGVVQISYEDVATLRKACEGATAVVHLPGVLVERRDATYETANVHTTEVVVEAARSASVQSFVLVSATGADPASRNRYFRTKGEAEQIALSSGLLTTVLRAPLLLGPHTEGTRALERETSSGTAWLLAGGRTWHQPMDVFDLADGVLRAALMPEVGPKQPLDVGGPERLRYRELVERAARLRGRRVRVRSIPRAPVRLLLEARARLMGPGMSPEVLEVLLTDTIVDGIAAAERLGISLTPLEVTLRRGLLLPEDG
jgi:NADH dehydrogenase